MKHIFVLISLLSLSACISYKHSPDDEKLIETIDCEVVTGNFTVEMRDAETVANLFLNKYVKLDGITISLVGNGLEVIATYHGAVVGTNATESNESFCKNNILTVDIPNIMVNDGGVSAYEARKIQLYAVNDRELIIRKMVTTSGLFMLIPVYGMQDYSYTLYRTDQ